MLNVFEAGEASFRLVDGEDRDVGWIRGAAIGFDGFRAEEDALAAAVAGRAALDGYLHRLTGAGQRVMPAAGPVATAHDGAHEWVTRGDLLLARLYRPQRETADRRRRATFGVEFVLPSYVKEGAAISASQVLHNAIATRAGAPTPSARGLSDSARDGVGAATSAAAP